jgi:hypothetical protein
METRYVFIDTSEYVSLNFGYDLSILNELRLLTEKQAAFLCTTTITVKEIESNIKAEVRRSRKAAAMFRKEAKILRNLKTDPYKQFFQDMDSKTVIVETLKEQLDRLLRATKAIMIPIKNVSVDDVFSRFFEKRPPFGPDKKKDEFPDAFVLLGLEDWCRQEKTKLYVVSGDKDMRSFCQDSEYLLWLEKTSEFINIVTQTDEKQAAFAQDLLVQNESRILEAMTEKFEQLGFFIEDQDGDVTSINVTTAEINDKSLIKVREDTAKANLIATVTYDAELEYDDLDTASYDSEDKVLIPWRTIEKTVTRDIEITVNLEFGFEPDDLGSFDITNIEIDSDVGICSDDDDPRPYK